MHEGLCSIIPPCAATTRLATSQLVILAPYYSSGHQKPIFSPLLCLTTPFFNTFWQPVLIPLCYPCLRSMSTFIWTSSILFGSLLDVISLVIRLCATRIKYICDKFGVYDLYALTWREVLRISFLIGFWFFSFPFSSLVSLFYNNFFLYFIFPFLSPSNLYKYVYSIV